MQEFLVNRMFEVSALCTGLSVFCFLMTIHLLHGMVEDEDRSFMDPIPPLMRPIWPLVRIIAHFFVQFLPYEYLESTEDKLQKTGVSYMVTAEQFIGLRILSAIFFLVLSLYMDAALPVNIPPVVHILAPFLGFLFPTLWLRDTRRKRELAVVRAMPVYLDFITMAVEAGLNLQGGLAQAMEKAPPGPLRNEFGIVLRDLRSGLSRADSLRRMAERLDIPEVTSFVTSMIQAERMGSSLAAVLRVQAEQRRNERFTRAEKVAMEAPVKLVFPLIVFIFPVTFVVLGFPIVMKFMAEGTL